MEELRKISPFTLNQLHKVFSARDFDTLTEYEQNVFLQTYLDSFCTKGEDIEKTVNSTIFNCVHTPKQNSRTIRSLD